MTIDGFERDYVIALVRRHGNDVGAAAREAGLTISRYRRLVRKHARPWLVDRVRSFYGEKLRGRAAEQVADELLALEPVG
jgi:hypothetical protein